MKAKQMRQRMEDEDIYDDEGIGVFLWWAYYNDLIEVTHKELKHSAGEVDFYKFVKEASDELLEDIWAQFCVEEPNDVPVAEQECTRHEYDADCECDICEEYRRELDECAREAYWDSKRDDALCGY